MKRILSLLLTIPLLFCLVPRVSAHDVPDVERLCSIELNVSYDGKPVSGGSLTAIRVGEVGESDGNYYFRSLMDSTVLLSNEVQTSKTAFEMADQVGDYDLETWEKKVPDNGIVKFENLKTGLYLIVQNNPAPGYNALAPFLVSLPYMEDGEYRYDVTAKIKSELDVKPKPTTEPSTEPTYPEKLPQTGQLTWPIPILSASGIALFVLGWILCFRNRRKDSYEE